MSPGVPATLAGGLRVVDLAGPEAESCGRILATMGADVIRVESPGGRGGRAAAPAREGDLDLESWAENLGKRSITLDLTDPRGHALLLRLLEDADALIHTRPAADSKAAGLDYESLREAFPRLIHVTVTPFGAGGPHSDWAATDLIVQAMGGHMYVTGDDDRPPVRVGVPVAYRHGGAEAAAMVMVAYYERQVSGLGQAIDISLQECLTWTMLNTTMTWELTGRDEVRGGIVRRERSSTIYTRLIWNCADGYVHFVPVGGGGGSSRVKSWDRLVTWMEESGFGAPILRARDWNGADQHSFGQEEYDALAGQIQRFLLSKTVAELYERAVGDVLLLAPVSTVADILASPQLEYRDYFAPVSDPALPQPVRMPGAFARLTQTPLLPPGRAPRTGEHNHEVLVGELGLSDAEYASLVSEGVV